MKTKSPLRWIVPLLAVAVIGGAGARYAMTRGPALPHYNTVAIDRGRIASKVTATGTLSALVTVQVGSQVSGRVESIKVDFNSPVKKGQVVATIDPQMFRAAVDQAQANYASAKANLEKSKAQALDAERQYTRSKQLGEQKLVAQADVDSAQATTDAARAQVAASEAAVQQAQAALSQANINLKYTTIVSPIDGIVISRSVDVGQTVAASLQAPTLFTIAQDLTKMQVDTSVAEGDVGKVHTGMSVGFVVDAYPGKRFDGVVRQVRDAATTVQNVVTYDAVIDVDNSERLLKPGMTATVTFTPAERNDALRIANTALRYRHEGASGPTAQAPKSSDKRTVWVLKNQHASPVDIQIGLSDGSVTEVVSGDLHEGDQVITEQTSESGSQAGSNGSGSAGGGGGGGSGGGGGGGRRGGI